MYTTEQNCNILNNLITTRGIAYRFCILSFSVAKLLLINELKVFLPSLLDYNFLRVRTVPLF